jgi:UDP-glucose 4-epimerase
MKILLTGASSFTGYWFAKTLADAGHHVVAPLRGTFAFYKDGIRAQRVEKLKGIVELIEDCRFGCTSFVDLVKTEKPAVLCHHAAQVGDYRSPDFDIAGAVAQNTLNLRQIVRILNEQGANGLLLTGSVFEQDEGAGQQPLRAFSAYGLSKGFTAQIAASYCEEFGLPYSKFVIPNPFGPYEEPRFCAYLIRSWKTGKIAIVNTPLYVRDNIHVDLLAKTYVRFAEKLRAGDAPSRCYPSGYLESQGSFALRFSSEMRNRSKLECRVELAQQTDFSEPLVRVNLKPALMCVGSWNEELAWNDLARFYFAT